MSERFSKAIVVFMFFISIAQDSYSQKENTIKVLSGPKNENSTILLDFEYDLGRLNEYPVLSNSLNYLFFRECHETNRGTSRYSMG